MTIDPRLERRLPAILDELGAGPAPAYADIVLERIAHVRQRPGWVFPTRWLPLDAARNMRVVRSVPWRLAALIALLTLAIVVAWILTGVGRPQRFPAPFGPALNGPIVYGGGGDILTGDPITGESRVIVPGSTYDFRPGYSPDGSMLAFLRRVDPAHPGLTDIVVAQADGTAARVVTATPLGSEPTNWEWAADSRSLTVLSGTGSGGKFELFTTDAASPPTAIHPAVTLDSPWAFQPPSGGRLLFRGHVGSKLGLFTMNLDGTDLIALVPPYASSNEQIDLAHPAWSPDGNQVVFQQIASDGATLGLRVIGADGSGSHPIASTAGYRSAGWPSWSPDGTRIAFQRADGVTNANGSPPYTWVVVRLADGAVVPTGPVMTVDTLAMWSPDSKGILVLNVAAGQPGFILDPEGGPARPVPWSAIGGDWQRTAP